MKININTVLLKRKKEHLTLIMRISVFLFCATVFSLTPENIFSQNAKIVIDSDKEVSIHQIFDLIKEQTNYTFIYNSNLFDDTSKISLKKGTILANTLLQNTLSNVDFSFEFSAYS
jgi:hypothetical protein